jgi:hypothetical protein
MDRIRKELGPNGETPSVLEFASLFVRGSEAFSAPMRGTVFPPGLLVGGTLSAAPVPRTRTLFRRESTDGRRRCCRPAFYSAATTGATPLCLSGKTRPSNKRGKRVKPALANLGFPAWSILGKPGATPVDDLVLGEPHDLPLRCVQRLRERTGCPPRAVGNDVRAGAPRKAGSPATKGRSRTCHPALRKASGRPTYSAATSTFFQKGNRRAEDRNPPQDR